MPRLRVLVCAGLAVAGAVQLVLLAALLGHGRSPAGGAAHIRPSAIEEQVPGPGEELLTFRGRGLSVSLRLGAGRQSLRWDSTTAELEGVGADEHAARGCGSRKLGPELFAIQPARRRRKGGDILSGECKLQDLRLDGSSVSAAFSCPGNFAVKWGLRLQQDQHFARISIELSPEPGASANSAPGRLRLLTVPADEACARVETTGTVEGSPVLIGNRWFLGVEHPLGLSSPIKGTFKAPGGSLGVQVGLGHLGGRHWPPRSGSSWRYGAVLGACGEASQARRAFLAYLDAARPPKRRQRQMLHYNSWFDMHSWQDEEFVPPHLDVYKLLQEEEMTEALALSRIEKFSEALGRNHSLPMDSYLWDDGWDDPKTLWDFDRARFPQGFSRVAAAAKAGGSGTGVWLSPWGGYGLAQKQRLKLGKRQGYETNSGGFSLAGPRYFARFRDAVLSMRRDYNVNLFKFDGVAGDPRELAEEMEAMLTLISEIRNASRSRGNRTSPHGSGSQEERRKAEGKEEDEDEEDPWINLTTGTWPSPFFLLWADSIWRGGGDVGVLKHAALAGLTVRQRWIVWRELLVCRNVFMRANWFPLAQLMIHGVVVGFHGEALLRGLHQHTELDFAQEAWSFVGMGLQLQELYLSPSLLEPVDWAHLAEALKWSRANMDVLRDSHWVLGNFSDNSPYGVASWRPATAEKPARGFLMLRNPIPLAQHTGDFTLDDILELPSRELGLKLKVEVVCSISDGPARSNCALGSDEVSGECRLEASRKTRVEMRRAEVLILGLQPVSPR